MCLDLAGGILDFKRSWGSYLFILAQTLVSDVLRNIEFMCFLLLLEMDIPAPAETLATVPVHIVNILILKVTQS